MKNLFIVNSPLQYLLSRTIADQIFSEDENFIIQYVDNGDFSPSFEQIDRWIGRHGFSGWWKHDAGAPLPSMTFNRVFMSNRFNPSEISIALKLRKHTDILCAFEDGISIYLSHFFLDKKKSENNIPRLVKNAAKIWLFDSPITTQRKPDFIPFSYFSEVYSIYPEIPAMRKSAIRIPIADHFRTNCMDGDVTNADNDISQTSCLLLSQSLTTDRLLTEDELVSFISDRIGELRQRYDRVYYKPHPRDPTALQQAAARLEVSPIPDDLRLCPVELFVARNPNTDIYGFWSSTLAYCPLFGSAAYSFGEACMTAFPGNAALQSAWQSNRVLMDRYGVRPYLSGVAG